MTGRPPSVQTATKRAIQAARDGGRLKAWHEPSAAVAIKLAAALSVPKLPVAELVRLSGELDKALSRLPLAEATESDGGGRGDGPAAASSGAGEGEPRPAGLASGVGPGPEVGDTALPA